MHVELWVCVTYVVWMAVLVLAFAALAVDRWRLQNRLKDTEGRIKVALRHWAEK